MSTPRVLIVAPQPFFEVRGTPLRVLQMVRVLCEACYEVHLATYGVGQPVSIPGLVVHRTPRLPGIPSVRPGFSWSKVVMDVPLALLVCRLMLRTRFDVVHAVEEAIFFTLPPALARGVPVIYDVESWLSDQLRYTNVIRNERVLALARRLEAEVLRHSAMATTVCQALTDAVRSLHADVPVVQIEDTPLLETFAGGDAICADALRQRYGLASAPVVLYTGNLESYQGVDLLFDALPSLAQHCPSARVLIVGGEQAHVDAAMQQLAQRGLADRVVFAGRRPTAEMPAHMAMAQALVSPRTNGTNTPLKLYSYMHAGVPIVATDLPTHTQVLDSECAVLCAPEAGALGRALANVLLEPEKFAHLGAAARERVLRDYSATEFRRKLLGAYGAVLSLSRSATARSA